MARMKTSTFISALTGWTAAAMILIGIAGFIYIQVISPNQPDPATNHVIRVMIEKTNVAIPIVIYVTPAADKCLGLSLLLIAAGVVGLILSAALTGKLKKPTSFG